MALANGGRFGCYRWLIMVGTRFDSVDALRGAAIVFLPSHLTSVGAEVFAADVVVLADFGAA